MNTSNYISSSYSRKNIFFLIGFCLFLSLLAPSLKAQSFFEGSLSYSISLDGKIAEDLNSNKPAQKMDMHIKGGDFIVQLYEARIPKTFLFISDSNHTYVVDAANQTYFLRDYYYDPDTVVPTAQIVKDTAHIMGHICRIYRVEKKGMVTYYYAPDDLRVDTRLYKGKDEAKANFLIEGLEGRIPLKTVIKKPGFETTILVTSIKPKVLAPNNFRIPGSFERKIRDRRK